MAAYVISGGATGGPLVQSSDTVSVKLSDLLGFLHLAASAGGRWPSLGILLWLFLSNSLGRIQLFTALTSLESSLVVLGKQDEPWCVVHVFSLSKAVDALGC